MLGYGFFFKKRTTGKKVFYYAQSKKTEVIYHSGRFPGEFTTLPMGNRKNSGKSRRDCGVMHTVFTEKILCHREKIFHAPDLEECRG